MTRAMQTKPKPPSTVAAISFYQFCEHCRQDTAWVLVIETRTQEGYQCQQCPTVKLYTVR